MLLERSSRLRAFLFILLSLCACHWDPEKPFEREAPPVNEAIAQLEAGKAPAAVATLEEYLSTGACADGNIGAPESLKKLPNGTFDLGLALFKIGEAFGRRFGEEELDGGADDPNRKAQIECALRVVRAIAADDAQPLELRARARYLEGNLLFLGAQYEEAVSAYDKALVLSPGVVDAGDPIGRDAAWNRAIALRRIDDKKDAGNDAAPDSPSDAPQDAPNDSGDAGKDGGDAGDSGGGDAASDASKDQPDAGPPPPPPDGGPPPRADQDERTLDQLESAPSLQQEVLKRQAKPPRGRGMVDK
jgi:tetratricopeptide (TPR) repeat protein